MKPDLGRRRLSRQVLWSLSSQLPEPYNEDFALVIFGWYLALIAYCLKQRRQLSKENP
jgi:hypothetical protein